MAKKGNNGEYRRIFKRIKKTEGHTPPRSTDENEKFAVIIQTDVRRETQRVREREGKSKEAWR